MGKKASNNQFIQPTDPPSPVLVSEEQRQQPQRFLLQRQGARQHAPGRVPEVSEGQRQPGKPEETGWEK